MPRTGPVAPLALPGLVEERGIEMTARDGVALVADIYRPAGDREVPALVQRTPYGRHWSVTEAYAHPYWYVARGYAVVCQDCRGCGDSGGTFEPFVNEGVDGADTVQWVAQLPWCSGAVGMYGFSYPGVAQLLAAAQRPPNLRAIAPAMAVGDIRDPWVFRGGALQLAWLLSWACEIGAQEAARAHAPSVAEEFTALGADPSRLFGAMPARDALTPELRRFVPFLERWLDRAEDLSYWAALSPDYEAIEVPALHVGGWYDVFLTGTVESYQRLASANAAPQSIVIGPWPHIPWQRSFGCCDFGSEAGTDIDETQRRFFDQCCKNHEDEEGRRSFARVFSMGDCRWLDAAQWPLPNNVRPLHLASGGRANSLAGDGALTDSAATRDSPPDVFVSNPHLPVVDAGGRSCCFPEVAPIGPSDQRSVEQRMDVLVYETEPLPADLLVAGDPRLVVFVLSDRPSIDLVARLCHVRADGISVNVSDGNVRLDLESGFNEVAVPLSPTVVRIAAGERIRLQIAGTSFPTLDRNPCTGSSAFVAHPDDYRSATIAIFHDQRYPSRIEIPAAGDLPKTGRRNGVRKAR